MGEKRWLGDGGEGLERRGWERGRITMEVVPRKDAAEEKARRERAGGNTFSGRDERRAPRAAPAGTAG